MLRIVYDLNGAAGGVFTVALEASSDGGQTFAIRPRATTGDVGSSVAPGTGKTIEWDSTKDVEDLQLERYVFRVVVSAVGSGRASALKLVIVDGENATNIVRTKTAVTPVVEVRDRSDRPVSGVPVTFVIASGRNITFAGGAATLTVSSDAAGRASATGLTPVSGGAVQIAVQAAFQGERATATIHQLNVITAAPAPAPASSSPPSAGKAGGGSSRGKIIGIVAGAAAVGVAAAKSGSSPQRVPRTFTATISAPMVVQFTLCRRLETWTGTLQLFLDIRSDGSVAGSASTNVSSRVDSLTPVANCPQEQVGGTGRTCCPRVRSQARRAGSFSAGGRRRPPIRRPVTSPMIGPSQETSHLTW